MSRSHHPIIQLGKKYPMRNRSKNLTQNCSGYWTRMLRRRASCSNPNSILNLFSGSATYNSFMQTSNSSVMSDQLSAKQALHRSEQRMTPKQKREASAVGVMSGKYQAFRPVNPCTHTTTKVVYCPEFLTLENNVNACPAEPWLYTSTYSNGAVYLRARHGVSDPYTQIVNMADSSGAVGDFRKHDWFALAAKFDEACDSFIPSNFLLGESMIESSIFIDAFKIIINPSNALRIFLKAVVGAGHKKKNLGAIAKLARNSSNAFLSYNFGVKPAIEDIISAVSAHEIVQKRLHYLSFNRGSYVPIRVRSVIDSDVTAPSWPSSYPIATSSNYWKVPLSRDSTATIGMYGRVREDLNWKDAWAAYVQYFGIAKITGLAWELIPFSFVLDWFTNVQERINHITRPHTGSPFSEFRALSASLKETTKSGIFLIPGTNQSISANVIQPNSHMQIAEITQSTYNRYNSIPSTSGVVDISSLGLFHFLASGALIVQRVLR